MSNKLRLIKIYELRGKIHPVEQYVIGFLDGIEQYNINHLSHIVYMKDGLYYFAYYPNNNNIYLYYNIYNILNFSEETKEIIKYLLEKHLKLKINNVE